MSNEYSYTFSSSTVPQSASFASSADTLVSASSAGLLVGSTGGSRLVDLSVGGGASSFESVIAELFAQADRNDDGKLNVAEATRLVLRLNSRLGRNYSENDALAFVRALDANGNGTIEYDEFRRAIIRQFSTVVSSSSSVGTTSLISQQASGHNSFEFVSALESELLRATNPIQINETETLTVNGQTGVWLNRNEVLNWRGVIPITQYIINEDSNPEIIRKQTEQQIVYEQEVAVRYLRPPTPPPPGEILIRQEKNIVTPPAPPLVIRQQPARPETPQPLVIREAPPRPPAAIGQKVITISGKRLPPVPRKVVIERLAPMPSKPQAIIIERWLPYSAQKRRVIFQRNAEADPVIQKPRNVIIQWEAPRVTIRKEFKDLGIIRANPVEYVEKYGASLKSASELPEIVREIRAPVGVVLAADYVAPSVYELEGDIQALSFIDLEREGLTEYRSYVSGGSSVNVTTSFGGSSSLAALSVGSVSVQSSTSSLDGVLAELFVSVDRNADGRINLQEAQRLLLRLNSRLGRNYGENEALTFVRALDANGNGTIEFDEFRRAILRQFA